MKKIKYSVLCFMLIFAMASLTACTSNNNETEAPTTSSPVTSSATSGTESTGVIDGMGNDVKEGMDDVKDGVEDALDMTTESTKAQ